MTSQKKTTNAEALQKAVECYRMGGGAAWFDALLTNDYRYDKNNAQATIQRTREACFDTIVRPEVSNPDDAERIRYQARKLTQR